MAGYSANYEQNGKKQFWITTVVILVIVGFAGYGVYEYRNKKKEEAIKPQGMMPQVSNEQMTVIKEGVRQFGRVALGVTPEQEKAIEAIWTHPPRNLDEVREFERKTDEILTPAQRQIVQPFRTAARTQVVDKIIEPAKKRMSPADYSKFRYKIQTRVAQRLSEK